MTGGVVQLNVPESWTVVKIDILVLILFDWVHIFGRRIDFTDWHQRFYPETSRISAMRGWERRKESFKLAGIQFKLMPTDSLGKTGDVHSILFESEDYIHSMIEALGGPQDHYPDFKPRSCLKTIDDFGPEVVERFAKESK